jgi:hypothetical protein
MRRSAEPVGTFATGCGKTLVAPPIARVVSARYKGIQGFCSYQATSGFAPWRAAWAPPVTVIFSIILNAIQTIG